ncbi:MAG: SDR family oxidoreductase, partial [Chloroflexaceae bacterium]|nr:SDR family oxidoreductase [Chloroflexaceae bacterium]
TVVITGRNLQKLEAYRERLLHEAGVAAERVYAVQMDGSDSDQVRRGVAEVLQRLGRIDVLVNNAGSAGARQRLPDIPLTQAELRGNDTETLSAGVGNLMGISWNLVRAVAPHMQPGGSIVNVSTIFSRTDYYGRIPYVVPKAALNALSQELAQELGARGIRVNTIYPGPIDSERIRTVFKAMDGLKGLPENSTAEGFFNIMSLSRPTTEGELAKGFPKTLDVANAAVFLGSDESAAINGHALEITHGMDVPTESRTTFVSRPGLRAVDATNKVVLVCAGDQIEDAMALTGVLRSCEAEVVLGFRSKSAIAQVDMMLRESRQIQAANYNPPLVLHLNPLDNDSMHTAFTAILDQVGVPNGVIILPAHGSHQRYPSPALADDAATQRFLQEEIVGAVALASRLARFWEERQAVPFGRKDAPRVLFMSNGDDGSGNVYANILRAGLEQLIRVWRHESELDTRRKATAAEQQTAGIWANQIVRYVNCEDASLDFAAAWAAKLLNSDRRVEEINLYLPQQIELTTGAQRPSFGWAENLIGLHLGKTAVITGGSAGIGGQVGRLLALSGAKVMLAARGADQLTQLRDDIMQELLEVGYNDVESRVHIVPDSDVAHEGQLAALVEKALATFGRIDYLINNAGIAGVEEMVIDMPHAGWRHTLNANLISNYSLIRKLLPTMKSQGSGYILNVSSYFGGEKYVAVPYPNRSDYAVSKAGQRAMAEVLARFMGPEVQINALAPGPVEGDRLRGTGERPGLFARRARLILENKRLNEVHAALIDSYRATGTPIADMVATLASNDVRAMAGDSRLPEPLRKLAASILDGGDTQGSSQLFLLNKSIAQKLVRRLVVGTHLPAHATLELAAQPPEPFFARTLIDREARKVRDGVMGMLYLQKMPTEYDVAIATVYYLADRAVTGETFHPSGGLRFERTGTEGELFGKPSPESLAALRDKTVFLIGEHMRTHLELLARTYLNEYRVARVVFISETAEGAQALLKPFADEQRQGRVAALAAGSDLEGAIDQARTSYGEPGPV